MIVSVRELSGECTEVQTEGSATVLQFKEALHGLRPEIDVDQMRIVFGGKALDDKTLLMDAGVAKGTTVFLVLRMKRGETREQPTDSRLQALLDCYEITIACAAEFAPLREYDITFLLDDSGSMGIKDSGSTRSRWAELKETAQTMLGFATHFNRSGTDVHFLNRDPVLDVADPEDPRLEQVFSKPPSGTTPLSRAVASIVKRRGAGGRPLLLVIATDGEPDSGPAEFMQQLRGMIADKRKPVRFQIMACTNDEHAIGWLNDFDVEFEEVDVCDDYASERAEVLASRRVPKFSRGDWVMKALLGPVSAKFDKWDEASPRRSAAARPAGARQGFGPLEIVLLILVLALLVAVGSN